MSSLNESIGSKGVKETNIQISRGVGSLSKMADLIKRSAPSKPWSDQKFKDYKNANTPKQVQEFSKKYPQK